MSEKTRNEIAGVLTKKEIEDLGSPWLSMAEAPPQYNYNVPNQYNNLPPAMGGDTGDTPSSFSLEGGGVGSIDNRKRRPEYDWQMRLRYGRSF